MEDVLKQSLNKFMEKFKRNFLWKSMEGNFGTISEEVFDMFNPPIPSDIPSENEVHIYSRNFSKDFLYGFLKESLEESLRKPMELFLEYFWRTFPRGEDPLEEVLKTIVQEFLKQSMENVLKKDFFGILSEWNL